MKTQLVVWVLVFFAFGCATTPKEISRITIYESKDISTAHDIIGPVSVNMQIKEDREDAIQGLAGFIARDGRVSDQIPADMKLALETKREQFKDMIYDQLADKAKKKGADAVIEAQYAYIPPYATFSPKATVIAKGNMVKFKK